jgi:hypothetical protein
MSDIAVAAPVPEDDKGKRSKPLPILTPEQKLLVAQHWEMNIRELTRLVFNDPLVDGRSIECKAVKQELASIGKVAVPITPKPDSDSALTDAHKEYVRNSVGSATPLEMARTLYGNEHLMPSSRECKAVIAYCREIDPSFRRGEELVDGPFVPPTEMKTLVPKVNRYAINPKRDGKAIYSFDNLSNNDRKQLQALLSYMDLTLYRIEGNKYTRRDDRELFESTFVAVCWDKSDLLPEEVIQYITFAAETVRRTQIERTISQLDERLQAVLEMPGARMNMTEVELLNTVREKANASMKQSATLLKALVGDRAKRKADQIQASASLHNLVEAWRREDDRRKIIQMNEKKQKVALKAEVERLSDLDSLKCEMFGLSKDDILN